MIGFPLHRVFKLVPAAFLGLLTAGASAQTKLDQQLANIDFGVQATGEFTGTVSGPITIPAFNEGTTVTQSGSNTVGALVTIRYSPKPYLGAEFNGSYARFTENFNVTPFQIQNEVNEFTFGYLVIPPYTVFGVKPYVSAGGGVIRFAPTAGGGEQAYAEARPGIYYNVGVQKDLPDSHFGVRVGFRELFYTAPDFYQNYLAINKHTSTSEPMFGFYLRF